MTSFRSPSPRGATLVEIAVVILVIVLATVLVLPRLHRGRMDANEAAAARMLRNLVAHQNKPQAGAPIWPQRPSAPVEAPRAGTAAR